LLLSSRRRHTILVSDWSSDVCSSDLLAVGEATAMSADGTPQKKAAKRRARSKAAAAKQQAQHQETMERLAAAEQRAQAAEQRAQIGRASCRERGESEEGAVSIKRKEM